MRRTAMAPLVVALVIPFAPGAVAQERSLQEELRWLQAEAVKVTTATLQEESVSEAPATVVVVTRRQMLERGYRNLQDLLWDLPGVDIQRNSETLLIDRIAIRGIFGNNRFVILQDGVRISAATNTPSIAIIDNYPLYNAKQVEVLYGPASALYGADAFTGVVNIITLDAEEVDGFQADLEGGQFGYVYGSFFGGKSVGDHFRFTAGGHYHDSDDPDLSDDYPAEFALGDLVTFAGTTYLTAGQREGFEQPRKSYSTFAKLGIGEGFTLGWNHSYFRAATSTGNKPDFVDYGAGGFAGTTMATLYAKYDVEINDRLSGNAHVSYSLYELDPESHYGNVFVDFKNGYKYDKGERFEAKPQLTLELERHTVTGGAIYQRFHAIPFTADLSKPYDTGKDPDDQGIFYPGSTLPVRIFDVNYDNVGLFVQDQARWTDRFSTILGVRVDHSSNYGTSTNPRLGIVFQPAERTTVKALYGEAFLAPSPLERYVNFGSFFEASPGTYESFFFRVPNPDLEPEKVHTAEVSVAHKASDALDLSASLYYSKSKRTILVAPTDPVQSGFVPGGTIFFTDAHQNIGSTTAYGIDAVATYTRRFENARLNVDGNVSWVDGHLRNDLSNVEVDLPFVSRFKAKASATYNHRDRFVVTPSVRYIGRASGFIADSADPNFGNTVPAYALLDLFFEARNLFEHFSFYLDTKNVLDRQYANAGEGGNFSFFESPQNGRWVVAGVRVEF